MTNATTIKSLEATLAEVNEKMEAIPAALLNSPYHKHLITVARTIGQEIYKLHGNKHAM